MVLKGLVLVHRVLLTRCSNAQLGSRPPPAETQLYPLLSSPFKNLAYTKDAFIHLDNHGPKIEDFRSFHQLWPLVWSQAALEKSDWSDYFQKAHSVHESNKYEGVYAYTHLQLVSSSTKKNRRSFISILLLIPTRSSTKQIVLKLLSVRTCDLFGKRPAVIKNGSKDFRGGL